MTTTTSRQRMSHLKRVGYCVTAAMILSALLCLLYFEVGGVFVYLAFPGMVIGGLLFIGGDTFHWLFIGNVILYSPLFYGISWAYTGLREEREDARAQADSVRPAT